MQKFILFSLSLILFVSACKSKEDTAKTYEVEKMLFNVGDNIILPNYLALDDAAVAFSSSIQTLKNNQDETSLLAAQIKFKSMYKAWQSTSAFLYFGPAENISISILNVFPTSVTRIADNISAGNYDLNGGANTNAVGFPAIDYLLFNGSSLEVLDQLTNAARLSYLEDVTNHLVAKINNVYTTWKNSYLADFKNSTGTASGSSISNLTNSFIQDFEAGGREAKIGIPAGIRTLNEAIPLSVEALHSKNSIELAKGQIESLKSLITGQGGAGFKTLLKEVEEEKIATAILGQLDHITAALNQLQDPFSMALEQDNAKAILAYNEYQKLLPLLKVELTAALGLLIDYQDNDGD